MTSQFKPAMLDIAQIFKVSVLSLLSVNINLLLAEPAPPASNNDATPFISFEGTQTPSTAAGWNTTMGLNVSAKPNQPDPGTLRITDNSAAIGSAFIMKSMPNAGGRFPKDLPSMEYEFEVKLAIQKCNKSNYPAIQAGMRDEGGKGKCLSLAWYRVNEKDHLLAFMHPGGGLTFPVTYANWSDGQMRTYVVKKYRKGADGKMVVQVLIDGVPQLSVPIPYDDFPDNPVDTQGFQIGTSSTSVGVFDLRKFAVGPLQEGPESTGAAHSASLQPPIPPVDTVPVEEAWNAEMEGQEGSLSLEAEGGKLDLAWETRVEATSKGIPVIPDRHYRLLADVETAAPAKLIVEVRQGSEKYSTPEPPHQSLVMDLNKGKSTLDLPFYTRNGNDRLNVVVRASGPSQKLSLGGMRLVGGGGYQIPVFQSVPGESPQISKEAILALAAARPAEPTRVVAEDGQVSLRIGEESAPLFFYSAVPDRGAYFGSFAEKGMHLMMISEGLKSATWRGPQRYDLGVLERLIERVLASDPDARIILGVFLDPYYDWGRDNPDEVCTNDRGQKAIGQNHLSGWGDNPQSNRFLPSIFSTRLQQDLASHLLRIDTWLDESPLGRTVVGYYLWGFNDGGWGHWAHGMTLNDQSPLDDYSKPAQEAFRKWLKEKYKDDVTALQQAWGQPGIDFHSVGIPSPKKRRARGEFFPWLGPSQQDVADFNAFYGAAPMKALSAITGPLREKRKTERIVIHPLGNVMHGWRGFTGFGELLRCRSVDAHATTSDYAIRWPGYAGGFNSVVDSLRLHGKVYFHEFDHRAFTVGSYLEANDFSIGLARDPASHESMFLRETANLASHGQGMYALDHTPPSFAHPEVMEGVARGLSIFKDATKWKEAPRADVAIFLNEGAVNRLGENEESSRLLSRLTRRQRPQWDTSGAPYHLLMQNDLTNPGLPDYRLYIFLMPQILSQEEKAAIERLKGGGRTLVFLHAPGLLDGGDPAENISHITGIRVSRTGRATQPLAATWSKSPHALLEGLEGNFGDRPQNWQFMDRESRGIAFKVDDPDAVSLATYRGSKDIAAAIKRFPDWTSVFLGVPWLEAGFINNLAKEASAWTVAKPYDAVFANQFLIGIHARTEGVKTLRPLRPGSIRDAFTGEMIADNAGEFSVQMPFGQTRIFLVEPGAPASREEADKAKNQPPSSLNNEH